MDRDWLLIMLALLVLLLLLSTAVIGLCSIGALPPPDVPPQPEIEDVADAPEPQPVRLTLTRRALEDPTLFALEPLP